MTGLPRDRLDVAAMHQRLTADGSRWKKWVPLAYDGVESADTWVFGGVGTRIFVSLDPDSEPGVDWIHASTAYTTPSRMPSYSDLKRMHHGVFGDGHAYQVFVPASQHISITHNVLHLWGHLDGTPALPNFGRAGTI